MNKSIKEKINKHLANEYIKDYTILSDLMEPTIAIRNNYKDITMSKFGGIPSFPKNFNLLNSINKSLSFVCQISLDEIKLFNEYNYFPNRGDMLYFFINSNFSFPIKKEDFKVLYINKGKDFLKPNADFSNNSTVFEEKFMGFYLHYNFPSFQNYKILELEEKGIELDEQIEKLQDFINYNGNHISNNVGSQIFGNPQSLQGSVSFHWATNSLNLHYPYSNTEIKKIKQLEKEFILLLQIDFSDIKITEQFGDGIFYFGIKEDELALGNFDNIQLVYQTT